MSLFPLSDCPNTERGGAQMKVRTCTALMDEAIFDWLQDNVNYVTASGLSPDD
jgi:hypothetical protein